MTKDYKKTADDGAQSGNYGWMFSGIALGLLVGLGMYFYSNHQATLAKEKALNGGNEVAGSNLDVFGDDATGGSQEPDPISVVIESARAEQQDRKRANFTYYAVLPNLDLDVTVTPSEKDNLVEAKVAEEVVLKPGSHILQIASFKSKPQATRVQGELSKQGLATHVEKKHIKGKDWFRLFAGPSAKQDDINTWKALVEKAGFRPLIVKIK